MAISADTVAQSKALAKRLRIAFPLLSDPGLEAIRAYGVRAEGRRIAVPAVFLIRQDGRVAYRFISGTIGSRASVDTLVREVTKVKAGR